jgi:hypothetical protein
MTTRSIPDFKRGSQSRRLSGRQTRSGLLGTPGLLVIIHHADRSFKCRSERTGRAFSLPDSSDRLFSWRLPFSLKLTRPPSCPEWASFPEGIRRRANLQEKSEGLSADRCLNQVLDKAQILSGYLSKKSRQAPVSDVHSAKRSICDSPFLNSFRVNVSTTS